MPLTTPLLAGTRVRTAERMGVELVVPRPSADRGIYVLHWRAVRDLCTPTLHDTVLFERCSSLTSVAPARVRDAALTVAREGFAGRQAASAAAVAIIQDGTERLRAEAEFLTALVDQVNAARPTTSAAAAPAPDLQQRVGTALAKIMPALERPMAQLITSLTAISDAFAPVGVAAADCAARIPRLLTRLEQTFDSLSGWLNASPDNDLDGLGKAIALALRIALECGMRVLDATRSALTDPMALLRRWLVDPGGVLAQATRCDWLLDGWERLCLLWLSADTWASRRAVLLEMAPLVPVLPREVLDWTDAPMPESATRAVCQVVSRRDDWRTGGSAFALIERNEKLLAMRT
ncbi:MAG TPA: hypothetical protein VGC09_00240 [Rhodopila sp.]